MHLREPPLHRHALASHVAHHDHRLQLLHALAQLVVFKLESVAAHVDLGVLAVQVVQLLVAEAQPLLQLLLLRVAVAPLRQELGELVPAQLQVPALLGASALARESSFTFAAKSPSSDDSELLYSRFNGSSSLLVLVAMPEPVAMLSRSSCNLRLFTSNFKAL